MKTQSVDTNVKAEKFFPVHWAMFKLSNHSWYDPIENLFKMFMNKEIELIAPKIGRVVNVNRDKNNEQWWK